MFQLLLGIPCDVAGFIHSFYKARDIFRNCHTISSVFSCGQTRHPSFGWAKKIIQHRNHWVIWFAHAFHILESFQTPIDQHHILGFFRLFRSKRPQLSFYIIHFLFHCRENWCGYLLSMAVEHKLYEAACSIFDKLAMFLFETNSNWECIYVN